jgi:hypothetical protein
MLRRVVLVVFVTGALVALMNMAPIQSVALLATPAAGTPVAGSPPTDELCLATDEIDSDIIDTGTAINVEPPGGGGVVTPADASDHLLWVVQITVAPEACRAFHAQDGAVVLFVHSGTIEYGVSSASTSAAVMMGHQGDAGTPVALDTLVTLNSGDWVTQDSAAWFTYRNPGPGSAVISMAAFVGGPGKVESSSGKG